MDNRKVNKIMLSPVPDFAKYEYLESINTMHKMSPTSPWLTSVQPAIWRKSELLKFLKPEYTPWNFEVEGSKLDSNHAHLHRDGQREQEFDLLVLGWSIRS